MGLLRLMRGFNLIVADNVNLFLEIDTLKLPALEESTEAFQPGGSDMEIEIAGLGIKAFAMPFKLKGHNPDVITMFGGEPGERLRFTGKSFVRSEEDGSEHEHSIDVSGRITKMEADEFQGGKVAGYNHEIKSIWDYTEYWDGKVLHRFSVKRGGWVIRGGKEIGTRRRQILSI